MMNEKRSGITIYTVFPTKLGFIGLMRTRLGLRKVTLPLPSYDRVIVELNVLGGGIDENPDDFASLRDKVRRYLEGERIVFDEELDLSDSTEFQKKVWKVTRSISYSETHSYLWIAQQVGNFQACRAVGMALARNPIPIIIPCHRVIANNGGLGGFSGGLAMKKMFLKLEGLLV